MSITSKAGHDRDLVAVILGVCCPRARSAVSRSGFPFTEGSSDNRVTDIGFAWDQVDRIRYKGGCCVKAGNAKGCLGARKVLTEIGGCFRSKPLDGRWRARRGEREERATCMKCEQSMVGLVVPLQLCGAPPAGVPATCSVEIVSLV